MSGEFLKGQVKWFNDAKGFGFIEHTSGKDVFVHYSVIDDQGFKTLKDGEEVLYELHEGAKGMHATKVVRIMKPQAENQISPADATVPSAPSSGLQVEVLYHYTL